MWESVRGECGEVCWGVGWWGEVPVRDVRRGMESVWGECGGSGEVCRGLGGDVGK